MRLIDIAAASSFALLSLAVIVTMNPTDVRVQSHSVAADSAAAAALLSYLHLHDLHFLATSDFGRICSTIVDWNNSSVVINIHVNHVSCVAVSGQPAYPGHFDLKLSLATREIELEAKAR